MKGYKQRKKGIRPIQKIIIIVCEGKKTETTYFKNFRERYSNVTIIPIHGNYTDPRNIVEFAIEQKSEWEIDLENGDGVWCVFDVDENRNEELHNSYEHARANDIEIALSNPSFELWFLLHYKNQQSYIERDEIIDELKTYIAGGYAKNKDVYNIINHNLQVAIDRAKTLNAKHQSDSVDLFSRNSNPSTQVHELIDFIVITKENNKGN